MQQSSRCSDHGQLRRSPRRVESEPARGPPQGGPRGPRRGRPGDVRTAQGSHPQDTWEVGHPGASLRGRGPRAVDRQDFLFLLLLGFRVALSPDGSVLQADGHESGPMWAPHRVQAVCGVSGGAILGQFG